MNARPLHILMVEDNPGDIELLTLAFKEHGLDAKLSVANDGLEALRYLHAADPLPDIVLLDLNLPKMSGIEFLDVVRQEPRTAKLPIAVLTSSKAGHDIQDAYLRHASCYIIKPNDLTLYLDVARQVEKFWARTCDTTRVDQE